MLDQDNYATKLCKGKSRCKIGLKMDETNEASGYVSFLKCRAVKTLYT